MEQTEDLCEIQNEATMKWKIKHFFPLCNEKGKLYESPKFYFSNSSWTLRIYPNGENDENRVLIYLHRVLNSPRLYVDCSITINAGDGENYEKISFEGFYGTKTVSLGKAFQREELTAMKHRITQSDDIILIVKLKSNETTAVTGSLFSRLHEVSDNLIDIYRKAKKTDVQFKVEDQIIGAHRLILEARSPVFSAMFNHDTRENQTGEVSIVDMDKSTLETILVYMYSGVIENMTKDTALQIYAAAEKYDLKAIKEVASKSIIDSLSVESVCDVIKFSELFQDKKISHLAREYFKENADKVLETDTWENFVKENHNISVELLATV